MRTLGLLSLLSLIAPMAIAQHPVDSLHGKVFAGYQGWFAPEIEGTRARWIHLGSGGKFEPGYTCVDMWPDTTGFDADELVATPFKFADGKPASVFSSSNPKTVDRHFLWMKQYGIDGAFLQRFGGTITSKTMSIHLQKVLDNVRKASKNHDRGWAIMYDLSGMRKGQIQSIVMEDWKRLVRDQKIRDDRTYIRHNGKPVVVVWGIGFNDNRDYTLDECLELVKFLKSDPVGGENTVMIGVPYYWRSLKNDTLNDPKVHQIIETADITSPWAVGRYARPQQLQKIQKDIYEADLKWLKERQKDYMPVIFPGFSWHNLMKGRGKESPTNQIPRLKGEFLWAQAAAIKRAGIDMLYIAMFDEIDEGTAIMKIAPEPPIGASPFVGTEGLASDHYLWLSGQIRKLLRGELKDDKMPVRP